MGGQWLSATLASLVLVSGALGDLRGRRQLYVVGIAWFALASIACALPPTATALIIARAVQGVGAALLTPGALCGHSVELRARGPPGGDRHVGGVSGIATAVGPFVGGFLFGHGGWRGIFAINVPVAAVVIALTLRYVPESRDPGRPTGDSIWSEPRHGGGPCGADALGLIGSGESSAARTIALCASGFGLLGLLSPGSDGRRGRWCRSFVRVPRLQRGQCHDAAGLWGAGRGALLSADDSVAGVGGLQPVGVRTGNAADHRRAVALSSRFAALAHRIDPRIPMSAGPILCAVGVVLLAPVGGHRVARRFQACAVFGLVWPPWSRR